MKIVKVSDAEGPPAGAVRASPPNAAQTGAVRSRTAFQHRRGFEGWQ